jgi:hypothetical protein
MTSRTHTPEDIKKIEREWMTPSEQLHLDAATYAHKKINTHKEMLRAQRMNLLTEEEFGRIWVAHYEGYTAGCEAKLKEKNG